jgi:hypothetical protein
MHVEGRLAASARGVPHGPPQPRPTVVPIISLTCWRASRPARHPALPNRSRKCKDVFHGGNNQAQACLCYASGDGWCPTSNCDATLVHPRQSQSVLIEPAAWTISRNSGATSNSSGVNDGEPQEVMQAAARGPIASEHHLPKVASPHHVPPDPLALPIFAKVSGSNTRWYQRYLPAVLHVSGPQYAPLQKSCYAVRHVGGLHSSSSGS